MTDPDVQMALEAAGIGVWTVDVESGRVSWTPEMATLYGRPDEPGELTLEGCVERIHPDDRDGVVEAIQAAMRSGTRFSCRHRIVLPDGTVRWLDTIGFLGEKTGSGVAFDVTRDVVDLEGERVARQAVDRERLLVETVFHIGQALAEHVELHDVIQAVTDSATSATGAAYGAFFYNSIGDDGETYLLYTISGAPPEAFASFPMPRNTAVFAPTFNGEATVRLNDVTTDPRYGHNAPHNGMPAGHLPVRSYLAVPVIAPGSEVLGGLFLGHPDVGVFRAYEERLAVGIAGQAALAVQNARLYETARIEADARRAAFEERAHVASVLQQSLLPPSLPAIPGLELAARYRAGTEDVGGDFYDVFALRGDTWGIVIGDVCGRGPAAAALTALTRHTVRTAAMIYRRPAQVIRTLNHAVHEGAEVGRFCTAVFGRLRVTALGATLTFANGGHPPLLAMRADGDVQAIIPTDPLIGHFPDPSFHDASLNLWPGDTLVAYTDGITEARRDGEQFGEGRLAALLRDGRALGLDALADRVIDAAVSFGASDPNADDPHADDMALLMLRVHPT